MTGGFSMSKHFGQSIIKDALRMRDEGLTYRKIADNYGLELKQMVLK